MNGTDWRGTAWVGLLGVAVVVFVAAGGASEGLGDARVSAPQVITQLPCRLEDPGAYRLESTLRASEAGVAILVAGDDVTIDLAGHALIGADGAAGIVAAAGVTNLTVRDGTLRGFGGAGIDASGATGVRVRDIRAIANGAEGILVGRESSVRDCLATSNASTGILVLEGSEVVDCLVAGNDGGGIDAAARSIVRTNQCRRNCSDGIRVGRGCVVVDNLSAENGSGSRGRPCRGAGIGYEGNPVKLGTNYTTGNDSEVERR